MLNEDIKRINSTDKVLIPADKSRNIYQIDKNDYNKFLRENVTKTYKRSTANQVKKINRQSKKIAEKLNIDDRVEKLQETEAYVTVKDHKDGFPNHPSFRLINPSKSDIGRISKKILDKINKIVILETNVNQWKNTNSVISWFKQLRDKNRLSFVNFDVESFYPSITENLFQEAINFAKNIVDISNTELSIVMQARKTLLFHDDTPWVKRSGNEEFDVPMGSYDGAEVCELVGCFLLNKLGHVMDKRFVGLYRDDGLGVLRNYSGPASERKRKELIKVFKQYNLSITIETNIRTVNFLDTTFDLLNNTYKPYRKPNDEPLYINKHSNHPPAVLRQLPKSISKRISEISSNEEIFKQSVPIYEKALKDSGFNEKLVYNKENTTSNEQNEKKKRKRKIIWFNPPYSSTVKTNVGKLFLKLVKQHFPKGHKLHKIFNKNTIKVSYSCLKNMGSVLSRHNKKILSRKEDQYGCNCRNKAECPLDNNCLTPRIIYQADVLTNLNDSRKFYIGLADTAFKERYRNHTRDFRNQHYEKSTELSKYIWGLKKKGIEYTIHWKVLSHVKGLTKKGFVVCV